MTILLKLAEITGKLRAWAEKKFYALVLRLGSAVYYIGGNDVLPPPLSAEEEEKMLPCGTKLFFVCEHRYYETDEKKGTGIVSLEFCICEGTLTGYIYHGYHEMKLIGKSPKGYRTPYYYKYADLGQKVFLSYEEAVEVAERRTREYEHIWGKINPRDQLLRRPWLSGVVN